MAKWECGCGCGAVVEAEKAPVCCGKKMKKAAEGEKTRACGCCCC